MQSVKPRDIRYGSDTSGPTCLARKRFDAAGRIGAVPPRALRVIGTALPWGSTKTLLLVALLSSCSLVVATSAVPQGLYADPGWQLKALQQYLAGVSPTFNHLTTPDPSNLARDTSGWISWWPPSTQLLVYPLATWLGLSLGSAVRAVSAVCLVIGAVGWVRWFALFQMPLWVKVGLAVLFPAVRYASNALFLYSQEVLVYSSVPWLLLWTYAFAQAWNGSAARSARWTPLAVPLGLGLGTLYALKYSAALVSVACLAYLALWPLRSALSRPESPDAVPCFTREPQAFGSLNGRATALLPPLAAACAFALPPLGLALFASAFGASANLVAASLHPNLRWESFLFLIANPALALADAGAPLAYVLLHPEHGLARNDLSLGIVGAPAGLLLLWVVSRRWYVAEGPGPLARMAFAVSLVAMLVLWSVSDGVSYEYRHLAAPSFALLPLVLQEGCRLWRESGSVLRRWLLSFAGLLFIGIPLAYGAASIAPKILRAADYVPGPSGLYNPLLATSNMVEVRKALLEGFDASTDVWYRTDPVTALDLPGRSIIVHADFLDASVLQRQAFATSGRVRIRALLPEHFERNGKGDAIRGSFTGARAWSSTSVPGSPVRLWTAWVD